MTLNGTGISSQHKKRRLHYVFGGLSIAQCPKRHGKHHGSVPFDNPSKRRFIPLQELANETLIGQSLDVFRVPLHDSMSALCKRFRRNGCRVSTFGIRGDFEHDTSIVATVDKTGRTKSTPSLVFFKFDSARLHWLASSQRHTVREIASRNALLCNPLFQRVECFL